jgi:CheY-like chemotaxis protein
MSLKVVVAEDSAVNRKVLVTILQKMGFEVLEHENGKAAWESLEKSPDGTIAAVFSDIMMPEMDGLQFLRQVRASEKLKAMPFVLLTAVSDKESIVQAKALNVSGYLLKPVSYDKVRKKVLEFFPNLNIPALAS